MVFFDGCDRKNSSGFSRCLEFGNSYIQGFFCIRPFSSGLFKKVEGGGEELTGFKGIGN